jgi:hypothetical protein
MSQPHTKIKVEKRPDVSDTRGKKENQDVTMEEVYVPEFLDDLGSSQIIFNVPKKMQNS